MMKNNALKKFVIGFLIIALSESLGNLHFILTVTPQSQKKELKFAYDFSSLQEACKKLPSYKPGALRAELKKSKNVLPAQELHYALDSYFNLIIHDTKVFLNTNNWVEGKLPHYLIKSLTDEKEFPLFDPYVEKIILSNKSIIAFHGDIHGDIHSLLAFLNDLEQRKFLNNFEIINPNFYMVFLGDFTDRGLYGPEVIYTILRLKIANPHRVFLVRGNHESESQNKYDKDDEFYFECFWSQLAFLFGDNETLFLFKKILKLYESMSLALYLGAQADKDRADFILCCHGGLEIGFDPYHLLNHPGSHAFTRLGVLDRWGQLQKLNNKENEQILNLFTKANKSICSFEDFLTTINSNNILYEPFLTAFVPQDLATAKFCPHFGRALPLLIGFQWNDYEVNVSVERGSRPCFVRNPLSRGFVIGKTFNEAMLRLNSDKKNIIHGVFRAHQHTAHPQDPMMKRILNKDNLDFYTNRGVGKLWIDPEFHECLPQQLWENIVCTFNVSPNTIYQIAGYQEDTYGLLKLGKGYKNWRLEVINQKTVVA